MIPLILAFSPRRRNFTYLLSEPVYVDATHNSRACEQGLDLASRGHRVLSAGLCYGQRSCGRPECNGIRQVLALGKCHRESGAEGVSTTSTLCGGTNPDSSGEA